MSEIRPITACLLFDLREIQNLFGRFILNTHSQSSAVCACCQGLTPLRLLCLLTKAKMTDLVHGHADECDAEEEKMADHQTPSHMGTFVPQHPGACYFNKLKNWTG